MLEAEQVDTPLHRQSKKESVIPGKFIPIPAHRLAAGHLGSPFGNWRRPNHQGCRKPMQMPSENQYVHRKDGGSRHESKEFLSAADPRHAQAAGTQTGESCSRCGEKIRSGVSESFDQSGGGLRSYV